MARSKLIVVLVIVFLNEYRKKRIKLKLLIKIHMEVDNINIVKPSTIPSLLEWLRKTLQNALYCKHLNYIT